MAASLVRRMEKPERGPGDQARAAGDGRLEHLITFIDNSIVFSIVFY